MRLRSGTRVRRRPVPTFRQLQRQYPPFTFPVDRRHRLPSRDVKSVRVPAHTRRLPLSKTWR